MGVPLSLDVSLSLPLPPALPKVDGKVPPGAGEQQPELREPGLCPQRASPALPRGAPKAPRL